MCVYVYRSDEPVNIQPYSTFSGPDSLQAGLVPRLLQRILPPQVPSHMLRGRLKKCRKCGHVLWNFWWFHCSWVGRCWKFILYHSKIILQFFHDHQCSLSIWTAFQTVVCSRIDDRRRQQLPTLNVHALNYWGHHPLFYGGISCQFMSQAHGSGEVGRGKLL